MALLEVERSVDRWQDCRCRSSKRSGRQLCWPNCSQRVCVAGVFREHVQREKEQDDATGNLEGGFGDVEIGENACPAQREEHHDVGGDSRTLKRGMIFSGTVLRFGNGKKNWCVADRVRHDEIDNEGGDEALEFVVVILCWLVSCPPL